jgi:23S rRNA (guanosine2251-2'-O)-methyltransferase
MAGNSKRQGAIRKAGSKKGAQVGSGGQRRRGLEAKGPTPKASERTGHPAAKHARATEKAESGGGTSSAAGRRVPRRLVADDVVVGRNPVVEALRAGVPARELLVVDLIDPDDRVAAAVALAAEHAVPVRERPKRELDRLAGDAHHQGLVLRTEPFTYADPRQLWESALGFAAAPVLVALDGITDPHNLGAIARSASALAPMASSFRRDARRG